MKTRSATTMLRSFAKVLVSGEAPRVPANSEICAQVSRVTDLVAELEDIAPRVSLPPEVVSRLAALVQRIQPVETGPPMKTQSTQMAQPVEEQPGQSAQPVEEQAGPSAQPVEEEAGPSLTELLPEVLNVIVETVAADEDVLQPRHLGSLARSCKVINAAVKDALDKLKVENAAASALVAKCIYTDVEVGKPIFFECQAYTLCLADAPALANVLKREAMVRLYCLHLEWNQIGDAGAIAVATALEKGMLLNLTFLYLSGCGIGDEGVKALMAAAGGGRHSKLEHLVLHGNDAIGEEGVGALADAIANGNLPSLKKLHVRKGHAENPRLKAACEKHGVELTGECWSRMRGPWLQYVFLEPPRRPRFITMEMAESYAARYPDEVCPAQFDILEESRALKDFAENENAHFEKNASTKAKLEREKANLERQLQARAAFEQHKAANQR